MKLFVKVIYVFLTFIEMLLIFRFIFLLVNANTDNFFVSSILYVSKLFVSPVLGILDMNWNVGDFYVDVDTIFALILYMVLGFGVFELVKVFSYKGK